MKFKIIGIGAAGNKAAMQLIDSNVVDQQNVILINSTDKDFPSEFKGKTIVLSDDNSGCGKERAVAKDYTVKALKHDIIDDIFDQDDDSVIIITSLEGGTGSGSSPLIGQYCVNVLGLNVHIIGFAGFEDDTRGLENTIEFFEDLDFECDIMIIKNSAFLNEVNNNRFKAEKLANLELVKNVEIILGSNIIASTQNIDDMDIFKVISTTGYKNIETIYFDKNLMDVDEFNKLCKQLIYNTKSMKSSEPSSNRMGVILNIRPESEDAIDYTFSLLKEEYGVPYETFLHKQYDGGRQYITVILSGMKMPLNEVRAIHERSLSESKKINKSKDDFFSQISSMKKDLDNTKFDMVRGGRRSSGNKSDFFKNLETKPNN